MGKRSGEAPDESRGRMRHYSLDELRQDLEKIERLYVEAKALRDSMEHLEIESVLIDGTKQIERAVTAFARFNDNIAKGIRQAIREAPNGEKT